MANGAGRCKLSTIPALLGHSEENGCLHGILELATAFRNLLRGNPIEENTHSYNQ